MITLNDISILIVSSDRNFEMLNDVYIHTREMYSDVEIVVVYDGAMQTQLNVDDKFLIQIPTNHRVYVGEGYNLAVKSSTKPYFVFLHDDTFIAPNFLENLIPYVSDKVFCNFCQTEPPIFNEPYSMEKPIIDFGGRDTPFDKDSFFKFYYQRSAHLLEKIKPSIYGGFFMAGSVNSFLEMGGFDEKIKPYFNEDSDLMVRLHMKGYSFVLSLDSLVYHVGSVTSRNLKNESHFAGLITSNIFIKKWKTTFDMYKEYAMKNKLIYYKNHIKFVYNDCNQYLINLIKLLESDSSDINLIVEIDGKIITNSDVNYLLTLPFIINDEISMGTYQLGNLKVQVIK